MTNISVKLVQTEAERLQAIAIRVEVFVREQGVPLSEEIDIDDETATHAIALLGGLPVGTGRLVYSPQTASALLEAKIGRMAVLRAWRRKGVGGQIMDVLEKAALKQGATQTVLHSQTYVQDFYSAHGYVPMGEPFLEVGIEHLQMSKMLVSS